MKEINKTHRIYFYSFKNEGDLICIKTGEAFEIIVESLPFANELTILRQCDGDDPLDTNSEDGKFPFDVSEIQNKLLDGQTDVTTYYFDENDVFIGNILPDIFETTSQTITITVENNSDLKCSDSTTLEFIVDDSPEFYEIIIPSNCDDGVSDIDGVINDINKKFDKKNYVSAVDIIENNFDKSKIENKIILIGSSAQAIFDIVKIPNGKTVPGIEIHAHIIDNILKNESIIKNFTTQAKNKIFSYY